VPALTSVTDDPATVQTAGLLEAKPTGSPDEAVAAIATGPPPKVCAGGAAKLMPASVPPMLPFLRNALS
jgi:hypothetical protein